MVILDNGHGKNTPGKRSPVWSDGTQLFEYEFNRDIVKRIHSSLKSIGINSYILVPEIEDIPLLERVNRVNTCHKNDINSILISVHANAGKGTGWEVYTTIGRDKSDDLATEIFKAGKSLLPSVTFRTDYSDGDSDKEIDFFILRKVTCPAVLTENFFMDTETDCRFIMSEEGRKLISNLHITGIINYLSLLR